MAKKKAKANRKAHMVQKKKAQKNTNVLLIAIAGALVVMAAALALIGNSSPQSVYVPISNNEQNIAPPVAYDACQISSQCFITYCKGQEKRCVNTTTFSDYSKNCMSYSDWVVETQDTSECACVSNVCKMLK